MTRREGWSLWLGASVVMLFVAACFWATSGFSLRPDTRRVIGLTIDSIAIEQARKHFLANYPNESSVCLYGTLRDTVLVAHDTLRVLVKYVRITEARSGATVAATPFEVEFADRHYGCYERVGLLGRAHPHLYTPRHVLCGASNIDALNLASDRTSLFLIVLCPYGRGAVLWQDGRRDILVWGREQQ